MLKLFLNKRRLNNRRLKAAPAYALKIVQNMSVFCAIRASS